MCFEVPPLTHTETESLRHSYSDPPSHIHIGNRLVPYKDYAELLSPTPVILSTIDGLMELALQPLNEINFVPTEATFEFSTGDRHVYQRLDDITNQWTRLRRELYTKTTVFLFANSKHYTTVISTPDCMTLLHFDSLNPSPTTEPWEIKVVKALFKDEALRQQREFSTNWTVQYPAIHMTKQIPYSNEAYHSEQPIHIDCGLYAVLMPMLYLLHKPLYIITPPSAHKFRLYAAHRILHAQALDCCLSSRDHSRQS